jgi:uncharacterized protein (DUF488 family)
MSERPVNTPAGTVWSLGHSSRPWDAFGALLRAHGIGAIADIRAFPTSRRWPHFNQEAMTQQLADAGVLYRWLPALGGRRHRPRPDSPHHAWTVAGFRNYADHMETAEFRAGLDALLALARERPTAFLCAEALYWRCHRRLVADKLKSLGWHVLHITGEQAAEEHRYPRFLRIVEGRLLYDVVQPADVQGDLNLL